jgi:hypothetical protein
MATAKSYGLTAPHNNAGSGVGYFSSTLADVPVLTPVSGPGAAFPEGRLDRCRVTRRQRTTHRQDQRRSLHV